MLSLRFVLLHFSLLMLLRVENVGSLLPCRLISVCFLRSKKGMMAENGDVEFLGTECRWFSADANCQL